MPRQKVLTTISTSNGPSNSPPSNALPIIFLPENERQADVKRAWTEREIMFCLGEAGTGKTHAAIALAFADLDAGRARKVMLCRPTVTNDEDIGFIKGSLDEKLGVWMGPVNDVLANLSPKKLQFWLDMKIVELVSLGMLRGRTVQDGTLIIDECQNMTEKQVICALTRIGKRGRIVFSGDPLQSDLPGRCAIWHAAQKLKHLKEVELFDFTGQRNLRSPLVSKILGVLSGTV